MALALFVLSASSAYGCTPASRSTPPWHPRTHPTLWTKSALACRYILWYWPLPSFILRPHGFADSLSLARIEQAGSITNADSPYDGKHLNWWCPLPYLRFDPDHTADVLRKCDVPWAIDSPARDFLSYPLAVICLLLNFVHSISATAAKSYGLDLPSCCSNIFSKSTLSTAFPYQPFPWAQCFPFSCGQSIQPFPVTPGFPHWCGQSVGWTIECYDWWVDFCYWC